MPCACSAFVCLTGKLLVGRGVESVSSVVHRRGNRFVGSPDMVVRFRKSVVIQRDRIILFVRRLFPVCFENARTGRGFTLEQLGERLGIRRSFIGQEETDGKLSSLEMPFRMAESFGISPTGEPLRKPERQWNKNRSPTAGNGFFRKGCVQENG